MKTGTMKLPLHGGKAPSWLFNRMKVLAKEIMAMMATEYTNTEILKRISDPLWFQALGCILGFDWHSSGVTTTVCGALKEASKVLGKDMGLYIAGGKGGASRKTPSEIEKTSDTLGIDLSHLVYNSKISAKVDNTALQDGYQLYHHCFFFTKDGNDWAVVQQSMNEEERMARRYHWCSRMDLDPVCEPHAAICCDKRRPSLNLVDKRSGKARDVIAELSSEKPVKLIKDIKKLREHASKTRLEYDLPARHDILKDDIDLKRLEKIFLKTYETRPAGFEDLLSIRGVGPKTIRALALISELVYGVEYSITDPARFSFAHGGKDGIPYPVDRKNYDTSIEILHKALKGSKISRTDKIKAIKRLTYFYDEQKRSSKHIK